MTASGQAQVNCKKLGHFFCLNIDDLFTLAKRKDDQDPPTQQRNPILPQQLILAQEYLERRSEEFGEHGHESNAQQIFEILHNWRFAGHTARRQERGKSLPVCGNGRNLGRNTWREKYG